MDWPAEHDSMWITFQHCTIISKSEYSTQKSTYDDYDYFIKFNEMISLVQRICIPQYHLLLKFYQT